MKKILAISGSNHAQSINTQLLKQAVSYVDEHPVTLLNLTEYPLPIYSPDIEAMGIPDNVKDLWDIFSNHDALMIAVPEHNGFMPAFLKNVIDWLSRIATNETGFFGTPNIPVLLLSTSPGSNGGETGLQTLKTLMPWWGGDVLGMYSLGSFHSHVSGVEFFSDTEQSINPLVTDFTKKL